MVTFLGDRISESLTGETADIAIKLFGNQLDALDRAGHQVAAAISTVPGVADVQFGAQSATPTFILSLDPAAMAASGLKTQDVLDAVGTDFSGLVVGQTYAGIRSVNVSLLLSPKERNDPATFEKVMIQGPFGPVPLSAVARITNGQSRYLVSHDGGQRYVSITFNVVGRGLQATSDAVQAKVAALHLPSGIYPEFAGAAAEAQASRNQMMLYSALALALIAMILAISFQWRSNTFLVLINMPFCLIGSVAAIVLMGQGISVGAMVGLVTVFGISARNAILLLAHYEHLVEAEGAVVFGKAVGRLPQTLNIAAPGFEGAVQVMNLDLAGVMVSAGSACSSGKVNPSATIAAMGREDLAGSTIRISVGWATTESDWQTFAAAWREAHARHRARRKEPA